MLTLKKCKLCPRKCNIDRYNNTGFCGAGSQAKIALVSLHPWEEPCLVGEKGAGTVFFSYCNLRCVYCQNYEISHGGKGIIVTDERLAEIFLEQQARGAATLDLVTPTHYALNIIKALDIARQQGFNLPVVYNSSAYETPETIAALNGYVDIYLPDLKYFSPEASEKYSKAKDYFKVASQAIQKMYEQVGKTVLANDGRMTSGVLVRHMVLPSYRHDSMQIVKWLWNNFGDNISISLMSQYTPMYKAGDYKKINRRLTTFEYESVVNYAIDLGIKKCFVQERRAASEEYVPSFDGRGVEK